MNGFARKKLKKMCLAVSCCLTINGFALGDCKKNRMNGDLEIIKHVLDNEYAPKEWKKNYAGWNLDVILDASKAKILDSSNMTTKQFQQVVKDFLGTTKDYHVNVHFFSTERATLPFTIKGVDDRYFIDWIDSKRLSPSVYPISIGDELVAFDGQPVDQVVQELKASAGRFANDQTDKSLAELSLTFRSGERGDFVPRGPVTIIVKSLIDDQPHPYQLIWNYRAEQIKSLYDLPPFVNRSLASIRKPTMRMEKKKKEFSTMMDALYRHPLCAHRSIGSYKSFLPSLGPIVWTIEDSPYHAYIYKNEEGKKIGYIRIPHYKNWGSEAERFGEIIGVFQDETDGLVIDQVDNPGGFVDNQYCLASMLTDYPLITPKHRLMINQQDVLEAIEVLDVLEQVHSDEEAESLFLGGGIFKTYQYVLFLKEHYRFIIDEWNAGRFLTDPIHIEGVDHINPHPRFHYSKPLLILINQLDFSGGDFFPAIMQDNKRATLFGTRTAGAGGYVRVFNFPNSHGIAGFSYTASIAERIDKRPIENLGVTPDIECQLVKEDLQQDYRLYVNRVNETMKELLIPKALKK